MLGGEFLNHFILLSKEIFPVFFLAIIAAALIDEFLPESFIENNFKKTNFFSLFNASILGALIPICTCGMIPLAFKLYKKGLNWKIIIAFLTAGNACSIPALWLTSILGWEIVLIRLATAIIYGVLVAYALALFFGDDFLVGLKKYELDEHCCAGLNKFQRITSDIWQMIKDFVPWIFLAVAIAAGLHIYFDTLVSNPIIEALSTSKIWGPMVTALIGFPFYFCAGADLPISSEFLRNGVSLGAVITFMTAAPGVNFTSLVVYKQCIGLRKAIALSLVSALLAWLLGSLINLV